MGDFCSVPYKAFSEIAKAIDNAFSDDFEESDMRICQIPEDYYRRRAENMRKFALRYIDEKEKMQTAFIKGLKDELE